MCQQTASEEPRLPPELERIIFVEAFLDGFNFPLLLVARRVHNWLLPHLYSVVVRYGQESKSVPANMDRAKFERYGQYVQHLLLGDSSKSDTYVLELCPNVNNLALWTGNYEDREIQAVAQLPLKRLSIDLCQLESSVPVLLGLFANVTHLDIADSSFHCAEHCEILRHFGSLTHFSTFDNCPADIIQMILGIRPNIKVFILVTGSNSEDALAVEQKENVAEFLGVDEADSRVVVLHCGYIADWKSGARGRLDMWKLAERIIAKRLRSPSPSKSKTDA